MGARDERTCQGCGHLRVEHKATVVLVVRPSSRGNAVVDAMPSWCHACDCRLFVPEPEVA